MLAQEILCALRGRAPLVARFAQDAAEQATPQRAPGDDAEPVMLGRGQHLLLDAAVNEVVQTLLTDQTEQLTGPRALLRLRDVPPGVVG